MSEENNIEITEDEDLMNNHQFFLFAYNTVRDCIKEAYRLQAREEFVLKDKKDIHERILEAKNFIEEKPQYQKYLTELQKALYEQNINVFNQLLTYFVKDVLKSDKEIQMELFVNRNMPAIRIEAINDGFKEDIIDGSGGAIANIVSTGLRLICLSRLPHRKFIILDEPDCWIKPEFVPAFAKIIGELSRKLRIQTVIISHHNWEYFKDYGRVIELEKDGTILQNYVKHDTAYDEDKIKHDYITEVSIRRFMSHHDTTYKLHPYLTCIIGKNDLGKSVIAPAFKAVAFNYSSDSYVKHNENSSQIYIKTSNGDGFLWERFKVKGKGQEQKVKYSLFKDDQLVTSEFNSNNTPSFISDKLQIMESEGIDVHISNQKTPIFMIGNDVSPKDKAKILSLGKEIIIIQKMMEEINSTSLEYSREKNRLEPLYEQYVRELKVLSGISDDIQGLEQLQAKLDGIKEYVAESEALLEMLPKLEALKKASELEKIADDLVEPLWEDEYDINQTLMDLEAGEKYSKLPKIKLLPAAPKFEDEVEINQLIIQLEALQKVKNENAILTVQIPTFEDEDEINALLFILDVLTPISTQEKIASINIPKFEDENELAQILELLETEADSIKRIEESINGLNVKKKANEKAKAELDKKIEEYYKETGSICPTCKQSVSFTIFKEHLL